MAAKKGCFSRFLKVVFVLLIVLFVLLTVLYLLMVGAPVSYPAPKFDSRDTGVMAGVITRLARSLVDKEGRVVETAELHLSQNEVQTLLDAMMRDDSEDAPETVPYAMVWDDGRIRFFYSSLDDSCHPLFSGKAINLHVELIPYVNDGKLTIVPGSASVGKLAMPRFAMNKLARWIEKDMMSRERIRTTLSAFTRIEPGEDSTLVLMFDPRDVNTVVRILRSAGKDPSAVEEDEDDEEEEEEYEEDEDDDREEDDEDDDDNDRDDAEDEVAEEAF